MIVTTESGSRYEIESDRVRRVNDRHAKRGDGDWQTLVRLWPDPPVVGISLVIVMGSLIGYGTDDYETPAESASPVTTRHTTPVTAIE